MAKLTERQKKNIIAAYAAGGISQKDLAIKYGVSESTIYKLLKSREDDFTGKVRDIKKEEEVRICASMAEYFSNGRAGAQKLLDRLLDIPDELIAASSLRDRIGAAHYVKDMFLDPEGGIGDGKVSVHITFADTSGSMDKESADGEKA